MLRLMVMKHRLLVVVLPLLGLLLGLSIAAARPTTVLRPHSCPPDSPRSACFGPPREAHRYWTYGLAGLAVGAVGGAVLGRRIGPVPDAR
jgi:hypothetical protein